MFASFYIQHSTGLKLTLLSHFDPNLITNNFVLGHPRVRLKSSRFDFLASTQCFLLQPRVADLKRLMVRSMDQIDIFMISPLGLSNRTVLTEFESRAFFCTVLLDLALLHVFCFA